MNGDMLSASVINKGYMNYKAKISRKVHLEEDPNFKCKSYTKAKPYSACLELSF